MQISIIRRAMARLRPACSLLAILSVTACLPASIPGCEKKEKVAVPEALGEGNRGVPEVAMSGRGGGVIVFEHSGHTLQEPRANARIRALTYGFGVGVFPQLAVVSAPTDNPPRRDRPAVVMDAQGGAIALWNLGTSVAAATRSQTLVWSNTSHLATEMHVAPSPVLAGDSLGNAIAAWVGNDSNAGAPTRISFALREAGGGWSVPRQIGDGPRDDLPRVVVNPSGRGWLSFQTVGPTGRYRRVIPVTLPGGPAGAPIRLGSDGPADTIAHVELAVDGAGIGLVVWEDLGSAQRVLLAQWVDPERGALGAPHILDPDRGALAAPELDVPGRHSQIAVAASEDGDAMVAWARGDDSIAVALYMDGVWQDDRLQLASALEPALAMTPAGDATLVYARLTSRRAGVVRVLAARRFLRADFDAAIPGSGWRSQVSELEPERDLEFTGPGGLFPRVAMESPGSAMVAWERPMNFATGDSRELRVFGWSEPLASFEVTHLGNRRVSFSPGASQQRVTSFPFDYPTPFLSLYEWDLDGDGTFDLTGPGADFEHTYPDGRWVVRLRVTDHEGLTAETTRTVVIDAAGSGMQVLVEIDGVASGGVRDDTGGINCFGFGTVEACSEIYDPPRPVTLLAEPLPGEEFRGWLLDCERFGTQQSIVLDPADPDVGDFVRCRAVFGPPAEPTLSVAIAEGGPDDVRVTSFPVGIDCIASAGSCAATFATGTVVRLTAGATESGSFAGCDRLIARESFVDDCEITLNADRAVTLTFE